MQPSDDVFTLAKVVALYGPSGAVGVILYLFEPRLRKAWNEQPVPSTRSTVFFAIDAITWVVGILFILLAVYFFYITNIRSEAMIRGTFSNLRGSETLSSSFVDLYLRRVYKSAGRFDYAWRIFTPKPIADGTRIQFNFDQSTCTSERVKGYELMVSQSLYGQDVTIKYDRKADKVLWEHNGKEDELPPMQDETALSPLETPSGFVTAAYAEELFSPNDFTARLESSDFIIRRDARTDLAREGAIALPWIQRVLRDPLSSYRLRLGVVSALNQMDTPTPASIDPAALNTVVAMSASSDPAFRAAARQYLVKRSSWELDAQLDRDLATQLSRVVRGLPVPADISELARTELEVLYNLGVSEKDRYGSRKPEDRERIGKAIDAFRKGWDLRSLASTKDRIVFAKALYGWGLALHDRSWIDRRPDGGRNLDTVKEAQEKFREFLDDVHQSGGAKAYPYPEQLTHAEAYLRNPVPESLQ